MARASAFQAEGCGFETRLPLHAHVAQSVEHFLGKEEVTGSIPVVGSAHAYLIDDRALNVHAQAT